MLIARHNKYKKMQKKPTCKQLTHVQLADPQVTGADLQICNSEELAHDFLKHEFWSSEF